MHFAKRFFPFLSWPKPTPQLLKSEAFAGLSVGLMIIPQGVAYAALAGMPLITGIYASLLPALMAVLFSASQRLSVGPTALTAILVSASLGGMATPGSAEWVNLTVWLSLMTGLLQVVLGLARFGWLLNLVSSPVLMAFTQGAGVLIISSQIPAMLGFTNGWSTLATGAGIDWTSLVFGLVTLVLLLLARRWRPTFPTVLVVVLGAAGASWALGLEASGTAVVGALPQGLPALFVPSVIEWEMFKQLVLPTLVITLVSFLETASSAKVESDRSGKRWDQDQDLIGQGLAKVASGLCGAFPTSSSFSRSALNLYAGAQSGWATLVSVAVILVILLFFTAVLQPVPQSVLAAIVVAAVLGLIKPRAFVRLYNINRVEAATAVVTFVITLLSAPRLYWGVLAGVVMGLSHFLHTRLHPRIIEVGLHPDGSLRDRHLWKLPPLAPKLYALRMDAELDFAAASTLERAVMEHLGQHPNVRHVCLFAMPINRIDATGVESLAKLEAMLRERGISLHISGMKLPVETVLRRAGCLQAHAGLHMYRTDAEAIAQLRQLEALPA
ncbi:MAG: sodium-independent anion transporter [Burkholderiales bacterium 35-55-47]|jgi:SulP family sulfate permease|uniref:SulP family inorganic anion transporter n=1 Tax=Limnohabitans sp. TaxID=1907725 RepID=UPI000BDBE526|nr:SulP family inorganic anion transporter [Limnohabitans sp.]OYY20281.1 MAG: sodium-independent anion transporter [Burkholderiales bacterium 35-55-47]OYZ74107.1 MAG: sodium-independent anion transporter [Burkholderiales bacterium 24-55-52]OZB02001.1 MAG: sodium-independent anion transporter [Burkholderiales bacterium 39-55-53]HQR86537.1 SulP family inorganic anion transporter [Limnohabitans sp.]HQS28046.1 SulP family inorganic anion transporter [Limnohabitans sp.]